MPQRSRTLAWTFSRNSAAKASAYSNGAEQLCDWFTATQQVISAKVTTITTTNFLHLELEARKRIPRDPNDWETVAIALLLEAAIWNKTATF